VFEGRAEGGGGERQSIGEVGWTADVEEGGGGATIRGGDRTATAMIGPWLDTWQLTLSHATHHVLGQS
jgi:hypothetical protein